MPKPKKRKRKGPKSTRAGCLMCKPHKDQANKDTESAMTANAKRKRDTARDQIDEALMDS